MKANLKKIIIFIVSCCIAIIIILSPTLILGHGYSELNIGVVQAGEVVMRITTLMVGLLVIYDAIKTYFK